MTIPEQAVQAALDVPVVGGRENYIRSILTAAAPHLAQVRVKKLEWNAHDSWNVAKTVIDHYVVRPCLATNYTGQYVLRLPGAEKNTLFPTVEAAKAAAQADYEARILSALEPSAGDMGNPITDKTVKRRIADALEYVWSALDCDVEHIESIIAHMQGNGLRIVDTVKIDNTEVILEPSAGRAAVLEEALRNLLHAVCGETGFASAVRQESGHAYPWPALDIAETAARRALSSQPVADGWLPIETAPKDGTYFLAWGSWKQEEPAFIAIACRFGEEPGRSTGWWVCGVTPFYPRKWRRLPTPPSGEVA